VEASFVGADSSCELVDTGSIIGGLKNMVAAQCAIPARYCDI
jgi:hypothetical protein